MKSTFIIFKFSYLKIPKNIIKLMEYETKVAKKNNEVNRNNSDIKKQFITLFSLHQK